MKGKGRARSGGFSHGSPVINKSLFYYLFLIWSNSYMQAKCMKEHRNDSGLGCSRAGKGGMEEDSSRKG